MKFALLKIGCLAVSVFLLSPHSFLVADSSEKMSQKGGRVESEVLEDGAKMIRRYDETGKLLSEEKEPAIPAPVSDEEMKNLLLKTMEPLAGDLPAQTDDSVSVPSDKKHQPSFKLDEHGEIAAQSYPGENPVTEDSPLKPVSDSAFAGEQNENGIPVFNAQPPPFDGGINVPHAAEPAADEAVQKAIRSTAQGPMAEEMIQLLNPKTGGTLSAPLPASSKSKISESDSKTSEE